TDNVLLQCIVEIRKAIGDDSRQPRWIRTFPKIGYRFIGEVEEICSNGLRIEETEEVTAVEFEFREEIINDIAPLDPRAERAPVSSLGRKLYRLLLHPAFVALLLISIPLSIYAALRLRHANSPVAETTLPQTPGKKAVA